MSWSPFILTMDLAAFWSEAKMVKPFPVMPKLFSIADELLRARLVRRRWDEVGGVDGDERSIDDDGGLSGAEADTRPTGSATRQPLRLRSSSP